MDERLIDANKTLISVDQCQLVVNSSSLKFYADR